MYAARIERARARMDELGVDVLLVSVGADLPYLTGYVAMPLERLTMLVVLSQGAATLVVPRLEAPRVVEVPDAFTLRAWEETEDPVGIVAHLASGARRVAIGDQTWARFVLALQDELPDADYGPASRVLGLLRAVKDADEIAALRAAAHATDTVAAEMASVPFAGRTEAAVSREFRERMLEAGHDRANFAIVAAGPNGASPHHEPGSRVIEEGDVVVCDFGGQMAGYCSDMTRMYVAGSPPDGFDEVFGVVAEAQREAVAAVRPGVPCGEIDAVARGVIASAGHAEAFIHRTGHGIGVEAHEDPYLVEGNEEPLRVGHAFSVEPGIYLPGRFGVRLEDIVVVAENGPDVLNVAPHDYHVVG